jgi:hypothetical protein
MSAEACGCDPEAQWVCKQHRESIIEQRDAWVRTNAFNTAFAMQAEMNRQTSASLEVVEHATTIEDSLKQLDRTIDELLAERKRIASVLADFYRAPISMSSLQPILNLAVTMNPDLKR